MTGGGFGGCTDNLVRSSRLQAFCGQIASQYERETGRRPDIFVTRPAGGAEELAGNTAN
jgi:galactokinase